jgi:hypothetical protein
MPHISLYVDEETLKKVEHAAKREHVSISKWVAGQIRSRTEAVYPAGFEDLYGSVPEDAIQRPVQVDFDKDAGRESF